MRIFTSIPPHYADPQKQEYLQACVASWTRCGFEAISLNRQAEVEAVRSMKLLEVIPVRTDEAWYPHRFGPCFGSIFDLAGDNEPVAIVNADIYMMGYPDLSKELASICSSGLTVARRTDVPFLGASTGRVSYGGIDLVALVKSSIPKTTTNSNIRRFQLGVPWWDYIVPILASLEGPVFRIEEPFIVHRSHEDRWDMDVWRNVSQEVRDILDDLAPGSFFSQHPTGEMQTANACLDWLFESGMMVTKTLPIETDIHFSYLPKLSGHAVQKARFPILTKILRRMRLK